MLRKIRASSAIARTLFGGDGASLAHGQWSPRPMLLDRLRELDRAIDEDLPLPVYGDDMIAVVEHQHLDEPAQPLLEIEGVLKAREIVLARMRDEDRHLDALEPRLDVVRELPELVERARVGARMAGRGGVAGGERLH